MRCRIRTSAGEQHGTDVEPDIRDEHVVDDGEAEDHHDPGQGAQPRGRRDPGESCFTDRTATRQRHTPVAGAETRRRA